MKAVESSLSYRGIAAAYHWAGRCATDSLTGRGLAFVGRGLRPPLAGSLSFGTARIRSAPLEVPTVSPAASAFSRPAFAVRSAVARGAVGRGLRGLSAAAPLSAFAGGDWARVVGAAVLGLGCGMIAGRPTVGGVLLVIGLILVAVGPWSLTAVAASGVARLFGKVAPPVGRPAGGLSGIHRTAWAAMVLALAAGALAGVGPSTRTVVALAVVIALAAAILWRPQLILLPVAAFPLVDWAARNALGGFGPLWDDALLVVGVALILWSVLVLGRDVPRSVPIALPVLFMLAAALASIVVNHVPNGPGLYGLRVMFQPILFYFVGFLIPKSRRWAGWAAGVFIAATTLLALHGLYQYATHAPMPAAWVDASETGITTRAFSVLGNPNLLGGMLIMGSLVSISLALSRATAGFRRLVLVGACVVQLGGLAVTFSRGAWIGFAVGLVALIVLAYRRYLLGVAAAVIVVWLAAPQVFIQRLLFSFSSAYAAKSVTGLGRLWRWESRGAAHRRQASAGSWAGDFRGYDRGPVRLLGDLGG